MVLTKLLTRSRFRGGDALGSISGLEWFEWPRFGLNPDLLGDGDGKGDGEGDENGEGRFFMMPFVELALSRLRREGELSGSVGIRGLSFSCGRNGGGGKGEANGDAKVLTRLFTLPRFREGEWERSESEGGPWSSEPCEGENGERTGEKNGDGKGADIKPAEGYVSQGRGVRQGKAKAEGNASVVFHSSIYPPRRHFESQHDPRALGHFQINYYYIRIFVYPIPAFLSRRTELARVKEKRNTKACGRATKPPG